MKTIKGPAIFLAQFVDKKAPLNSLEGMCKWAADLGYKGIQIPTWESFLIDLDKAAESQDYCDEIKGVLDENNIEYDCWVKTSAGNYDCPSEGEVRGGDCFD